MNIIQIILCEGASEFAYIQELNRLLQREIFSNYRFKPIEIGNGFYNDIIKTYKKEYNTYNKKNKKTKIPINIWVDKDLYIRNDRNCKIDYENKPDYIPDFLFTINNFEDFLVLHCDKDVVYNWVGICNQNNHFTVPMYSGKYEQLIKDNIFPNYKKGSLPFELTLDKLIQAYRNHNDIKIPIKCEFLEYLAELNIF